MSRLVVGDTSPINYLILIGHIEILPQLFERVLLPEAVRKELRDGPSPVRQWIADSPPWLEVRSTEAPRDEALRLLGAGEAAAIVLAEALSADMLMMDERRGAAVARRKGLIVTGTLGILVMAAQQQLVHLPAAFERLRQTTFRCSLELYRQLLADAAETGDRR